MKFYTVGVLGGGQLGRMMADAAHKLGWQIAVLDPDPDAPAGQVADRHVVGSFRDAAKIRELAQGCDVLTVEIEHIDTAALEALEREGVSIQPTPGTLRLIQDKYAQKEHLTQHGVLVAPARLVDESSLVESVQAAVDAFGLPVVLKARRLAYDGRGNVVIQRVEQIPEAVAKLGGGSGLYVEQWMPFEKELAVMVTRGLDGSLVDYPVVETIHRENICHTVIAPAPVSGLILRRAREVARQAIGTLNGAGIFGVEMFLQSDGAVLVNEIAPRPHNSGHYSIEACAVSQFEQHLRAVAGAPLGDGSMHADAAVMVNVLGTADEDVENTLRPIEVALGLPGAGIHWYGKKQTRAGRKMGHITLTGPSLHALLPAVRQLTEVVIKPPPLVGIIMGSDSDLPTMRAAAEQLREFEVPFELTIVSAHRTPLRMVDYARSAHTRGLRVIIAGAGGAAHLPGMVAALTPLPVIGVPVRTEPLGGQDALYSIVQMPRGVPVATVAIGNATNAGLLAVRILASHDPELRVRMLEYQARMEHSVLDKVEKIERDGWDEAR